MDSAAISALLGVILGGGLTRGADMYKTWRDERSRSRVAARSVIREFRMLDAQLASCIRHSEPWPAERFDPYEWPLHEPVLAAAIKDDLEWRKMEDVFATLGILRLLGDEMAADASPEERASQRDVLVTLREDMTAAIRILGRWATG